jgi:hypothetical protein
VFLKINHKINVCFRLKLISNLLTQNMIIIPLPKYGRDARIWAKFGVFLWYGAAYFMYYRHPFFTFQAAHGEECMIIGHPVVRTKLLTIIGIDLLSGHPPVKWRVVPRDSGIPRPGLRQPRFALVDTKVDGPQCHDPPVGQRSSHLEIRLTACSSLCYFRCNP